MIITAIFSGVRICMVTIFFCIIDHHHLQWGEAEAGDHEGVKVEAGDHEGVEVGYHEVVKVEAGDKEEDRVKEEVKVSEGAERTSSRDYQ